MLEMDLKYIFFKVVLLPLFYYIDAWFWEDSKVCCRMGLRVTILFYQRVYEYVHQLKQMVK